MSSMLSFPPEVAANFIEQWEGFKERPYVCPAGVLTIGFGHTQGVHKGQVVTYHEAYDLLVEDIEKVRCRLAPFVNVPVTENQFIALVSLAFNVGPNYVIHSCPKLMHALNTMDYEECAHQFLDIVCVTVVEDGKKVKKRLPGLVRRRQAEAKLFLE